MRSDEENYVSYMETDFKHQKSLVSIRRQKGAAAACDNPGSRPAKIVTPPHGNRAGRP